MRWEPEGPAWQYVMLDKLSPSIDRTLIEENLKRTPAERFQAMVDCLAHGGGAFTSCLIAEVHRAPAGGLSIGARS